MKAYEANFDGLVGPTHNYAGLSYGNVASMNHKALVSNPREAALQGLQKMKALSDLGMKQGVLAPQERPDMESLRRIGFEGSDAEVLEKAFRTSPELLAACSSASSMWTANSATVCPGADSEDGKVHFTAANLINKFHRSIESDTTTRILRATFQDENHFAHHGALPTGAALGDEGAANHTRFCKEYGDKGLQFFVYGRVALAEGASREPKRFPARQTLEASQAVARLNRVRRDQCVFAQQNPDAIDAGAFHNDVVSVGNQNVLFYHELAFVEPDTVIRQLQDRFEKLSSKEFFAIEVKSKDVPLLDAVKSYLFNSQLITLPNGKMCLVAPEECRETASVRNYTDRLRSEGKTPIQEIRYFNLRQSMQNGGGPACLRLRVVLSDQELAATNQKTLINDETFAKLTSWVSKHYRDRLETKDLADPQLLTESRTALDELTQILDLGSVYPFQL